MKKQDLKHLLSSPAAFPVSPSPPQENGRVLRMNATCVRRCAALLPSCGPGKEVIANNLYPSRMPPIFQISFESPFLASGFRASDNVRIGSRSNAVAQDGINAPSRVFVLRVTLNMICGRIVAPWKTLQICLYAVNRQRREGSLDISKSIRAVARRGHRLNRFKGNLIDAVPAPYKRRVDCFSRSVISDGKHTVRPVAVAGVLACLLPEPPVCSKRQIQKWIPGGNDSGDSSRNAGILAEIL